MDFEFGKEEIVSTCKVQFYEAPVSFGSEDKLNYAVVVLTGGSASHLASFHSYFSKVLS